MKKNLYLFVFLLAYETIANGYPYVVSPYSTEIAQNFAKIGVYIKEYERAAESRFLDKLPLYSKKKWEEKYYDQMKKLPLAKGSLRYPDVYYNIWLFDKRIDIMWDYQYENVYHRYAGPGWAYSSAEKKELVAKDRAFFKKSMLFCKQVLSNSRDKITLAYLEIFEELLRTGGGNLAFYHDFGMLAYLNNNFDKTYELLSALVDKAQKNNQIDQLTAEVYHDLGSACVEVMAYDKAIKYLSDSIRLDPGNKQAYFDRATAYFETGQFDLAIDDYLTSDKSTKVSRSKIPSKEFTKALCKSLCEGVAESAMDFVPSICGTTYGIGKTLWATAKAPIESTKAFSSACYEMGKCFVDYCKTVDSNTIDGYIDHLKNLYVQFDHLNDSEKGELIGHAIGKYGVEIFAGGVVVGGAIKGGKALAKGASAYRKLKDVNRAYNLKAIAISDVNKKKIVAESLKHAAERDKYFKNVRIHWDRQNKHIPGAHNFQTGKGAILIEKSELEALIKERAGKGQRVTGAIFEANFKERVDFGKTIGEYALESKGKPTQYIPTTKGIIHYDKNGSVHVIPSDPCAIIE